MALLAGALDERFALVVPNGSGAGGAGASRILGPGAESVGMNDKPHWYHERIQSFGGREDRLPFDQHFLKALVAPRALLCLESSDDLFANPEGTRATTAAARPVFELLGRPEANAICFRRGGHTIDGPRNARRQARRRRRRQGGGQRRGRQGGGQRRGRQGGGHRRGRRPRARGQRRCEQRRQ